jgi:hypothetical protein
MRTTQIVLAVLGLALAASPALADDVAGMYDVKYDEVSTNCPSPLKYTHGKLEIKVKGTQLTVDIDRTPIMVGSPAKNAKVSAKSKSGPTMLDGMAGSFSVAGKVTPEGMLTLVMVGEYTAGGKALCTQSWNVVGIKADAAKPPVKKKAAGLFDDGDGTAWPFVALPSFER